MMYAFAARGDCHVVDEPFYGAYLAHTGLDHPMRAEVLAAQPHDADEVVRAVTAPVETPHRYLKLMTHHMLPGMPTDWLEGFRQVFLIRHPARVIASYTAKREAPVLEDLGFLQQDGLFAQADATIVVDAHDIRAAPERMLAALCEALDLPFSPRMLSWPAGGRPEDGVWAPHWYGAVHRSTGFAGAEGPLPPVEPAFSQVFERCMAVYDRLSKVRIAVN